MSTTPITTINPPSAEIVQAIADMEDTMLDTCIVHTRADAAEDEYGLPGAAWTDSAATRCGYRIAELCVVEPLTVSRSLVGCGTRASSAAAAPASLPDVNAHASP